MHTNAYAQQIELGIRELHGVLADIPDAVFNQRMAPGEWSIGEILRHVIVTGEVALREIERMNRQAKEQGLHGDGAIVNSLLGRLVLWMIEPPYRVRVKAVASLQPDRSNESKSAVVAEYEQLQKRVLQAYEDARGLDLSALSAKLPTGVPFRHGEWFFMITAHQRRHLYQISMLKQSIERSMPN